jgi:membrane protein YqaA with SNARE-associated domain
MVLFEYGYVGLFVASFLSATIIPFSSEAVLSALLLTDYNIFLCVILATIGNTLGGFTGYWLGRLGKWDLIEKYLRISYNKINDFSIKNKRWGYFLALFSWLPFIGDFIPIMLGLLRFNWIIIFLLMLAGKLARYVSIAYFIANIQQ